MNQSHSAEVPKSNNETIISIQLTNSNEYAYDSFITDKKQIYSDETIISIQLTTAMNMLMIASLPLKTKLYSNENSGKVSSGENTSKRFTVFILLINIFDISVLLKAHEFYLSSLLFYSFY